MKKTAPASSAVESLALERTMTYRLHLLHKLSDRESQHAYLEKAGMPIGEGRCLAAIGSFEPLSVKDLAQKANLNKGQASRGAQSLVERGLVQKEASGTDARGVVLTLTREGAKVWKKVMNVIAQRNDDIFGCLNRAEQAQLSEFFDRMIAHARPDAESLKDEEK